MATETGNGSTARDTQKQTSGLEDTPFAAQLPDQTLHCATGLQSPGSGSNGITIHYGSEPSLRGTGSPTATPIVDLRRFVTDQPSPTYTGIAHDEQEAAREDLQRQAQALSDVLGKFSDGDNPHPKYEVKEDGKLIIGAGNFQRIIDVTALDAEIGDQRTEYQATNHRVIDRAREVCPNIERVLAPCNGAETTGLNAEHTIATDVLPIGSPSQIDALYTNQYARAMYVANKLDLGYSWSGMTNEIGFLGAALQWDIKDIQQGTIQTIAYLDSEGNEVDADALNNENTSPAGIRIAYTSPDGKARTHEQYSCTGATLPEHLRTQLTRRDFDALYVRATDKLVTTSTNAPEYQSYVHGVKQGGIVVSDQDIRDLTYHFDTAFSDRNIVALGPDEGFGWANPSRPRIMGFSELDEIVNILTVAEQDTQTDEIIHRLENRELDCFEKFDERFAADQPHVKAHSDRVGANAARVVEALGWDTQRVEVARNAGAHHDAGKFFEDLLPDFNGVEVFSEAVKKEMTEKHSEFGARTLAQFQRTDEEIVVAQLHHAIGSENFLALPQELRDLCVVVAMVDIYDAMAVDNRAYRQRSGLENVREEWRKKLGDYLTPEMEEAFVTKVMPTYTTETSDQELTQDGIAALSEIGITADEIADRRILAVGYGPSELLPPYDTSRQQQRAETILGYLNQSSGRVTNLNQTDYLPGNIDTQKLFPDGKVIEVVGGLADNCVASSVVTIAYSGLYAYIDSRNILSKYPPTLSDQELEAAVVRSVGDYTRIQRLQLTDSVSLYYIDQPIEETKPVDKLGNSIIERTYTKHMYGKAYELQEDVSITRQGENLLKDHPDLLDVIDTGVNALNTQNADEIDLGNGITMKRDLSMPPGHQSIVYMLEVAGRKYVIKRPNLHEEGPYRNDSYRRVQRQSQTIMRDIPQVFEEAGVKLHTILFASDRQLVTKAEEGRHPTREEVDDKLTRFLSYVGYYIDTQSQKDEELWGDIYEDANPNNFIISADGIYVWVDSFLKRVNLTEDANDDF